MPGHKDIDVVILCGGLGRRLRSILDDRPKSMAEINAEPFLDFLIKRLYNFGFRRFILCVGYMADKIEAHYKRKKSFGIVFSREKSPLGTGGAVKKARRLLKSSTFLVINGDSFCGADINRFVEFHYKKKALASLALTENRQNKECGQVVLRKDQKILNFKEKAGFKKAALVSAGIYLFRKGIFHLMPTRKEFSLEYDLFPVLIGKEFFGYRSSKPLIDIGTPDGFRRAEAYFKKPAKERDRDCG